MFDQYGQPTGGYGQVSPFQDRPQPTTPGQPGRPRIQPLTQAIAGQGLPPGQPAAVNPPAPPKSPLASPGGDIHDFMLSQLKMGKNPAEVAAAANKQFNRSTGNEAVYYPDNNTIGLPDSYLAGPTGRPDSPSEWGVTMRSPEHNAMGGGTTGGNTGFLSMLLGGNTPQTVNLQPTTSTGAISPLLTAVMGAKPQY